MKRNLRKTRFLSPLKKNSQALLIGTSSPILSRIGLASSSVSTRKFLNFSLLSKEAIKPNKSMPERNVWPTESKKLPLKS